MFSNSIHSTRLSHAYHVLFNKFLFFNFEFSVLNSQFLFSFISQVGFAKLKKMADNRANIGGAIIGVPIVGQ